jgi:hypothetical protein
VKNAKFSECSKCYLKSKDDSKSHTDKPTDKTTDKKQDAGRKPFSADCKFCGKHHDAYSQLKSCIDKFKYYSTEEVALLREINSEPRKRTEVPSQRISRETEWVKRRLESSKKV